MKKCPYCAEEIQDAAVVCKHCRKDLPAAIVPEQPSPAKPRTSAQRIGAILVYSLLGLAGITVLIALTSGNDNPPETPAKTLSVEVRASGTELQITNQGSPAGIPVTIYLNGTPPFTYRADATMPPTGETVLRVPLVSFTKKDGERFNPFSHAVTTVWIGGNGYDYKSFTFGR